MFQDSWELYEARYPKKWIFHPRKRSYAGPLLTVLVAVFVIAVAMART